MIHEGVLPLAEAIQIPLVLAIIALALVLFATDWLSFDITALLIMALLMLTGLVSPREGISGFANSATITVLAMFILSGGIERTGLVHWVADQVVALAGRNPFKQVLLLVAVVGPVSAFINNTAAVAILLPMTVAVARDTRTSPSKLLIPLSFASMLGGVMTLIGTSTNLIASGLAEEFLGPEAGLSLFTFSQVGFLVFLVGSVYLLTVGFRLLPDRVPPEQEAGGFRLEEYLGEVRVTPGSPFAGQRVTETLLSRVLGIDVLEVIRGEEVLRPPLDEVALRAGDVLVLSASRDELRRVSQIEGLDPVPQLDEATLPLTDAEVTLVEAIVPPNSRFIGRSLSALRFHERYRAQVVAVSKTRAQPRRKPLFARAPRRMHERPLDPGDLLLFQVTQDALQRLEMDPDVLVVEAIPMEAYRRERIPVAVAIMAGVVLFAALGIYPILVTAVAGAVLMVLTGCLRVGELYQSVQWNVIFLLGGLIPLGIAMVNTGAAALLGGFVAALAGVLPPLAILIVLFGVTVLLTSLISNNATVLIMVPVAVSAAIALALNPVTFLLTVMFAASTSFMTPTGYQTNTMVWGPGGYRFTDYLRVGGPLSALLTVVTPLLLVAFFPL